MFRLLRPVLQSNLRAAPVARTPLSFSHSALRNFHTSRLSLETQKSPVQSVEELVGYRNTYVKPEPKDVQPLKEAPEIYARIHVHNWSMQVTPGDIVKLPVRMRDVEVGNTLNFSEVSEIGSRNFTLSGGEKGKGRIDPSVFSIKGVCLEKSRVKRTVADKTRRRRRHVRHVVSNNCLTVIRVSEVKLN